MYRMLNAQEHSTESGIYMYSFALYPEDYQPSGTINYPVSKVCKSEHCHKCYIRKEHKRIIAPKYDFSRGSQLWRILQMEHLYRKIKLEYLDRRDGFSLWCASGRTNVLRDMRPNPTTRSYRFWLMRLVEYPLCTVSFPIMAPVKVEELQLVLMDNELYIPMDFWLNRNADVALPSIAFHYGQQLATIELAGDGGDQCCCKK